MIFNLLHDRHTLSEVACIKRAIEDRYGLYGVQVHDRGYFHVPFRGPRLDASLLLRYMSGVLGHDMCLWVVDEEIFNSRIRCCFRLFHRKVRRPFPFSDGSSHSCQRSHPRSWACLGTESLPERLRHEPHKKQGGGGEEVLNPLSWRLNAAPWSHSRP
jgi:hypothetical protein